jgi:hypothetical protein
MAQDPNINRVSFEEIEEYHLLDFEKAPNGQYSIVSIVTNGKVVHGKILADLGSTAPIPDLNLVTAIGNSSTVGLDIQGATTIRDGLSIGIPSAETVIIDNAGIQVIGKFNHKSGNAYFEDGLTIGTQFISEVTATLNASTPQDVALQINGVAKGQQPQAIPEDDELATVKYVLDNISAPPSNPPSVPEERLIPPGGGTEQILSKVNGDDYNIHWVDKPTGGGGTDPDALPKAGGTMVGDITMDDTNRIYFSYEPGSSYSKNYIYGDNDGSDTYVHIGAEDLVRFESDAPPYYSTTSISTGKPPSGTLIVNTRDNGGKALYGIWTGTQTEYNNIPSTALDARILYIIKG